MSEITDILIAAGVAAAGYFVWKGIDKTSGALQYTGTDGQPKGAVAEVGTWLLGPSPQQEATARSNANNAFAASLVTSPTQADWAAKFKLDAKNAFSQGNYQLYDTGVGKVGLTIIPGSINRV